MARNWFRVGLGVFAAIAATIGAFVVGLFVYVNATATPIHPDPKAVTSIARSAPAAKWTAAVDQSRQVVRAALTGRTTSPGIFDVLALLGRDESLARIADQMVEPNE